MAEDDHYDADGVLDVAASLVPEGSGQATQRKGRENLGDKGSYSETVIEIEPEEICAEVENVGNYGDSSVSYELVQAPVGCYGSDYACDHNIYLKRRDYVHSKEDKGC